MNEFVFFDLHLETIGIMNIEKNGKAIRHEQREQHDVARGSV